MGLVLAFESAPRPAARPPLRRLEPAESADILFFTGVRYERDEHGQVQQPATQAQPADVTPAS